MTLNGVMAVFSVILPNLVALWASYITVVEVTDPQCMQQKCVA